MRYLLLGAGLQGTAIALDLIRNVDDTESLIICDRDREAVAVLAARLDDPRVETVVGDITDAGLVAPLMRDATTAISAVNYWFNPALTELAIAGGAHLVDLGGNNDIVRRQLDQDGAARAAGVTIIPDCGLAPGLAGLLGYHLADGLDEAHEVRLRVGGLPADPRPPLDYMLVFSAQGLINEYIEPAEVIRNGELKTVPSLTEVEELVFPEPFGLLEAFQTSGGTSTLPQTLAGKVRNLDYKTIRYRGHCEKIRLLVDLGLTGSDALDIRGQAVAPRDVLAAVLERHLPTEGEDIVLLLCEALGEVGGRVVRRAIRIIDRQDPTTGLSAMTRMTGFPTAIIAEMLARGEVDRPGAVPQELVVPAERMLDELRRRGIEPEVWEDDLQ